MLFSHPLMGVALRLHARNLPEDQADAVRLALRPRHHADLMAALEDAAGNDADEKTLLAMSASVGAKGDGTIIKMLLDFLNAHWADIFALIVKLLGGL